MFQHHYRYHDPDPVMVTAAVIWTRVMETVMVNPGVPVNNIKNQIFTEEFSKLEPEMVEKVKACLPKRLENSVHKAKMRKLELLFKE